MKIVIGGGAAGLMAAGQAASQGAKVLILEKMPRPARKLCITGKGRCNITNVAEMREFIGHFGKNGNFLRQAFHQFFVPELMGFLKDQGLPLVIERGGRVFPKSGKAMDVTDCLVRFLKKLGVTIQTNSKVEKLLIENNQIKGVVVKGKTIPADAVILATGGASYPKTGSTGDGYIFAKFAGHKIIPNQPALVPLETAESAAGKMAGLNLRNINVTMFVDGKKTREAFGEVVFAEFGMTGPVILTLSKEIVKLMKQKCKVELSIDLKPALDEKKLDARLIRDFTNRSKEPFNSVLRGLMAKEMVPICIEQTKIPAKKQVNQISAEERKKLRNWLKDLRFQITRSRPMDEAIVTAGGIDLSEINPKTMESKIVAGLYFAGEIIDVDADTGGYNLQAAFSTGWLAGRSCAVVS